MTAMTTMTTSTTTTTTPKQESEIEMNKMNKRLSLAILTRPWVNANANGENSGGNGIALQHLTAGEFDFTTINGCAIRAAARLGLQDLGHPTWRSVSRTGYVYGEDRVKEMVKAVPKHMGARTWIDLLFGYMVKAEGMDKALKKEDSLRSCVYVGSAISTTPYSYDRVMGLGQKPKDGDPAPFTFERHLARYFYTVDISLEDVVDLVEEKSIPFLNAILETFMGLRIGGRQASNLSEMVPEGLFWRTYDVRGQGFLGLGHDFRMTPEIWSLDKSGIQLLAPMDALAKQYGFTFGHAGIDPNGLTIRAGMDQIKALQAECVTQLQASKKG